MATKEITGKTRVWVHLAHPSGHVRATATFNRAFQKRNLDVVAVSSDVTPADLPALMRGLKGWRNLAGMGVTMPHKQSIIALCDEVVGLAKLSGAVNAIRREPDGRFIGTNMDGSGFLAGLRKAGYDPKGQRVLLAGVGGAGRAIAFCMAQAGAAELTLANRTVSKAEELAQAVATAFPATRTRVGPPDPAGYDLVINATPLGMHAGDPLPLDASRLSPPTVVADIVTSPEQTCFLEQAERRGCRVHRGLAMIIGQIEELIAFLRLESPQPGK